ncbi:MAG: xanthan lyase [Bacteroidales bacterium]|nr:xanthan lyase [Bacteroidales bacterium]
MRRWIHRLLPAGLALLLAAPLPAQNVRSDFRAATDSVKVLLQERMHANVALEVNQILKRDKVLDFYFNRELGSFSWSTEDVAWLQRTLRSLFPDGYKDYSLGRIYAYRTPLEGLATPRLGNDGKPVAYELSSPEAAAQESFVRQVGGQRFRRGMSGRTLAVWQSHGRYYNEQEGRWMWQRAPLHRTVEDLYTQSYVLPFLIPMLENAGAYVLTPRERDTQVMEVICDNDPAFPGARDGLLRRAGRYRETGSWSAAGEGFADAKREYAVDDNPFVMGTARQAAAGGSNVPTATARWTPDIPERGRYAVYVSYKTVPGSTGAAHYTVRHFGGTTEFSVDQRVGGGTWIYLGTFEFDAGTDGWVELDNAVPAGAQPGSGDTVTADGCKFGGGMGRIARGGQLSGLPAYTEASLYWTRWAGIDASYTEKWDGDYTKDLAGHGTWATMMKKERGVPFDLTLAVHSDAGATQNDSIVGTLAIYTLLNENSSRLPDGRSRALARSMSDLVQTQLVQDIRAGFEPEWSRRELWDRSYSESRTTPAPGMIIEMLSHQNFADMKYGLDPSFRFAVSLAIYKGLLKFMSNMYEVPYEVQPLPVRTFSVRFATGADGRPDRSRAVLQWRQTPDPLEPTATAKGFILQTRIDDRAFDEGRILTDYSAHDGLYSFEVPVTPGHIYSFRILAWNDGGRSFPSETLAIGSPAGDARDLLIVNNFYRISAPTWFDTPVVAGFDAATDSGVPYLEDISYTGENYQLRRDLPWVDDDNAGFGASYTDHAGEKVAGNTFDYVYVHGKAALAAGWAFCSAGSEAWAENPALDAGCAAADLICGKQVTTRIGRGAVPNRFQVFPAPLRSAISAFTAGGGNLLISGSYIGTDVWDRIYPIEIDKEDRDARIRFVENTLGYTWRSNYAGRSGLVYPVGTTYAGAPELRFSNTLNPEIYSAENVNGLVPAASTARTTLRYRGSDVSAAVFYDAGSYKVASFGFPLETLRSPDALAALMASTLSLF